MITGTWHNFICKRRGFMAEVPALHMFHFACPFPLRGTGHLGQKKDYSSSSSSSSSTSLTGGLRPSMTMLFFFA